MGSSINEQLSFEAVVFLQKLFSGSLHIDELVFDTPGAVRFAQMERPSHE